VWLLSDTRQDPRRDVVGIFNWEDTEKTFDYDLHWLGLEPGITYCVFDFWENRKIEDISGRMRITVPPQSCRILAVRSVAEHPQVLSTSRHVTQGIVDLLEEKWDESNRTLRGRSKVVPGDVYEIRVATRREVESFSAAGKRSASLKTELQQSSGLLRGRIEPIDTQEVFWEMKFK
jgi:hypothetical protein